MKSIKEKAEETCIKYGSLGDIAYSEFVEGANYVLDAIEECFNSKDDIVKQWGAIATLVEQLKGNK